jgi:hypothetical protein
VSTGCKQELVQHAQRHVVAMAGEDVNRNTPPFAAKFEKPTRSRRRRREGRPAGREARTSGDNFPCERIDDDPFAAGFPFGSEPPLSFERAAFNWRHIVCRCGIALPSNIERSLPKL